MLKQRVITALVLIPIVLWGIFYLERGAFATFVGVVIVLGAWEWGRMSNANSMEQWGYALFCACLLFVLWRIPVLSRFIVLMGVCWWGTACFLVSGFPETAQCWKKSICVQRLIGLCILLPAWQGLILLKNLPNGNWYILCVMIFIWLADSGAYFVGRQWGKHKLAPKVSPGKSWEGFAGGLVVTSLTALVLYVLCGMSERTSSWLFLLGVMILVVFSVLGDLTESMFKREAGVKDSSQLLPGHGGILDRIDSLTAAIPMAVMLLWGLGIF